MKKTATVFIAVLAIAGALSAQEAPKVGVEFSQRMDSEFVDYDVAKTSMGNDAVYSRTEIKASAEIKLADNMSLTTSVKDRLEGRFNPKSDASGMRERNRLYLNADLGMKASDLANLGFGLEYRLESDVKGGTASPVLPANRITPTFSVKGKAGDVSYGIAQSVPLYLDATPTDDANDLVVEFDGVYSAGYGMKLSETAKLSFAFNTNLIVTLPKEDAPSSDKATILNYGTLTATLGLGDFSPFLGAFMNTSVDKAGDTAANIVGATFGAAFASGKTSLSFAYNKGYNTAEGMDNRSEDTLSVAVKIK
ncbi:hypothetical protein K7J14_05110 [Treponema zuelzerae]|uniref:Uncharacterized protein n=1 Tax=Teretinema zuelzerae TaxID=156 RepID=A0AAE3EHU5_9SPIR|nr:hypothetical protein [Teretinema zuelzerae]MCD1654078.1 hypothetical protein [Teretinema zuelzerae]